MIGILVLKWIISNSNSKLRSMSLSTTGLVFLVSKLFWYILSNCPPDPPKLIAVSYSSSLSLLGKDLGKNKNEYLRSIWAGCFIPNQGELEGGGKWPQHKIKVSDSSWSEETTVQHAYVKADKREWFIQSTAVFDCGPNSQLGALDFKAQVNWHWNSRLVHMDCKSSIIDYVTPMCEQNLKEFTCIIINYL